MNPFFGRLHSKSGFTFIEIFMVLAIIGILAGIVVVSYDVLMAKVRFSQVRASMDAIAGAGFMDYTTNTAWAPLPLSYGSMPPSFAATNSLQKWPNSPCPDWAYTWDNWSDLASPDDVVRVSLRNAVGKPIFSYCLDNYQGSGNCMFTESGFGSPPFDISAPPRGMRAIYCNEQ